MARAKVRRRRGKRFAPPADLTYQQNLVRILTKLEARVKSLVLEQYPKWLEETRDGLRLDAPSTPLGAVLEGVMLRLNMVTDEARAASLEQGRFVERLNQRQANEQASRLLGIQPFRADPFISRLVNDFADANAQQISSLSSTAVSQVGQLIRTGLLGGESTRDIGSAISERFGVAKSRARFIARDQTGTLNSQLSAVRMQSVGIDTYSWSTSADKRVRDEHKTRNGITYRFSSPPADGNPGEAPGCRCVAIPVIDDD
jgi:SPP1 gp7 family putative phage head morphogenesis protein